MSDGCKQEVKNRIGPAVSLMSRKTVKKIITREYKMTHQATAKIWSLFGHKHGVDRSVYFVFLTPTLALQHIFLWRMDGRTDTMLENNDHLFCCGLAGSIKHELWTVDPYQSTIDQSKVVISLISQAKQSKIDYYLLVQNLVGLHDIFHW